MDGYQKTENLKLNKITGDMIVDIEPIDENFKKIDTAFGDVNATIGNINDTPLDGYNEATDGNKSVANFIKYLWKKFFEIKKTVDEHKAGVDECAKILGESVKKHEKSNNLLEVGMGLRDYEDI